MPLVYAKCRLGFARRRTCPQRVHAHARTHTHTHTHSNTCTDTDTCIHAHRCGCVCSIGVCGKGWHAGPLRSSGGLPSVTAGVGWVYMCPCTSTSMQVCAYVQLCCSSECVCDAGGRDLMCTEGVMSLSKANPVPKRHPMQPGSSCLVTAFGSPIGQACSLADVHVSCN
jgi:hypothetical protein